MIIVLEMPVQADPHAWFAFDVDDLLRKLGAHDAEAVADSHRIYWDEAEAMAAFERVDDPAWVEGRWRARWALREQLVALEILSDDQ
jgi:hypothetical protein